MDYKATLDTFAKLITIGTIILFIIIGQKSVRIFISGPNNFTTILSHAGILSLLGGVIIYSYLYSPQYYSLNDKELIIHRPANDIKIKLSDVAKARGIKDNEMIGTSRTFGIGGLFGYYGNYYIPKIGHVRQYATQQRNRILIITKQNVKFIITPNNFNLLDKLIQ